MSRWFVLSLMGLSVLTVGSLAAVPAVAQEAVAQDEEETDTEKSLYDFKVKDIEGEEVSLDKYKGKTVLIVNVASKCGYTKQYADMQKAYEKFKGRDFVILGFPCNQFGGQEPGTEKEIKEFCESKYGVEFPMFSKIEVKGDGSNPLYKYLTQLKTEPVGAGDVAWNFEKFLINSEGKVVGRYKSNVSPTSEAMVKLLDEMLPEAKEDN